MILKRHKLGTRSSNLLSNYSRNFLTNLVRSCQTITPIIYQTERIGCCYSSFLHCKSTQIYTRISCFPVVYRFFSTNKEKDKKDDKLSDSKDENEKENSNKENKSNNDKEKDETSFTDSPLGQATFMFFGAYCAVLILSYFVGYKTKRYEDFDTVEGHDLPDSTSNSGGMNHDDPSINHHAMSYTPHDHMPRYISWNEFVNLMLAKGEVQEVVVKPEVEAAIIYLYPGAIINGKKADTLVYHLVIPEVDKFEDKIRTVERQLGIRPEDMVPVIYERPDDSGWFNVIVILAFAGALLATFRRNIKIKPPLGGDFMGQLGKAKYRLVDPLVGGGKGIKFSDVAGLTEAKLEIMEFVDYLKNPKRFKDLGAKVPKGALLLGPPGCGKTLLAKATATEADVPFLVMAGPEFVEMIGGLGAARVRDLFKEARKRAPSIIYIDEIDAVGRKRAEVGSGPRMGTGEEEQTLNQLLVEMDGMGTAESVVIMASTNRADVLDKALTRPGRFDRHILVDLPTLKERQELFELHLKTVVLGSGKLPSYYAPRMAALTPGMSGADIANICNEAALYAARESDKSVTLKHLEYALDRILAGPVKRSANIGPEEKSLVAIHESGHALFAWLAETPEAILKISIVPRTKGISGYTKLSASFTGDKTLFTQKELFEKICQCLAGKIAENLVFGKMTTSGQEDLKRATKIAYAIVKSYGMSDVLGPVSFPTTDPTGDTKGVDWDIKPYSKKLAKIIDMEVGDLMMKAKRHTEDILRKNLNKLKMLSQELLAKETLDYDEIEGVIGSPPYPKKRPPLENVIRAEIAAAQERNTDPPKVPENGIKNEKNAPARN